MSEMNWMRWLLLIAGILLVAMGIGMLFTPLSNLLSLALFISLAMLVSGISEIFSYFGEAKAHRSGWILASGILTALFGCWLLFGRGMASLTIVLPFLFAAWVTSAGIMRAMGSFTLKDLGSHDWGWVLALGILEAILGFVLLFHPMYSVVVAGTLLAVIFLCYGFSNIAMFFSLTRVREALKKLGR